MDTGIRRQIKLKMDEHKRKHGKKPTVLCLDQPTEVRLAASLVSDMLDHNRYSSNKRKAQARQLIDQICREGIRDLNIVLYGMYLRFDCGSFKVDGR